MCIVGAAIAWRSRVGLCVLLLSICGLVAGCGSAGSGGSSHAKDGSGVRVALAASTTSSTATRTTAARARTAAARTRARRERTRTATTPSIPRTTPVATTRRAVTRTRSAATRERLVSLAAARRRAAELLSAKHRAAATHAARAGHSQQVSRAEVLAAERRAKDQARRALAQARKVTAAAVRADPSLCLKRSGALAPTRGLSRSAAIARAMRVRKLVLRCLAAGHSALGPGVSASDGGSVR